MKARRVVMFFSPDVAARSRSPEVATDDASIPREPLVSRVILCRVGEKPRVTCLDADPGGDDTAALDRLFGVGFQVACVMLDDGIGLCCDRDVLLFGLALARRALATSPSAPPWPAPMLRFDRSAPVLGSDESPVSADFLLARVDTDGELVDLTDSDIEHWMFWLGLDSFLSL